MWNRKEGRKFSLAGMESSKAETCEWAQPRETERAEKDGELWETGSG